MKNVNNKDVNVFIKENIKSIGSNIYVAPDIPDRKLNNVIKAFKCEDFYKSILAIYDDTLFSSAKEGLVFTGERFIHHIYGTFFYADIESVTYVEEVVTNDHQEKKIIDQYIFIKTKDNQEHKLRDGLIYIDKKKFADFLNNIINNFDFYKEENQLMPIEDMSDDLKVAYLKIIINMAYMDTNHIDKGRLAELLHLMTRLNIHSEARFKVRLYIANLSIDNMESVEKLVEIIKEESTPSLHNSLMFSLVKDLINVYFCIKDKIDRKFDFLERHRELFGISDDKIALAYKAIDQDYKLLRSDTDDNMIESGVKELAAKAAAAGVPLGAIYISGSVVGLSAAGITSGLATLGLGLGMTGGLAVVGLIGVLSYKGMKFLTGADEVEKYKKKEMMLHEVIKQTQKTISLVIDDINYLVRKLNDVIKHRTEQKEKINKLVKMITQYQCALKTLDDKVDSTHGIILRAHCPRVLDHERLMSLTSEPTKRSLYDFVIKNYDLIQEKDGNGEYTQKYILKKGINTELLDKMVEVFHKIGYFDIDKTVQSKVSSLIKGWLK